MLVAALLLAALQVRIVQELRAMDGMDLFAVDRACDQFLRSRGATLSPVGQGIVAGRPAGAGSVIILIFA
jgi:hypothetical protein